ncbi:MAG TPA: hypothetical protein IAB26_05570 [Candidatus Limivivens merdigallinarum]|uniref:Uncharacterized protein n=1 Tax=Candidatus Limivivens merdigallinarum TaxID=2840859 RepID=A0A9D0ZV06_9FIRM|nr:hypothetical protein [Candidatus Limivivens merdigallinarum]
MDEKRKQILSVIVQVIIFIICLVLVIIGQRNVGPQGTLVMILGLAGLIGLLYHYNRKFK